MFNVLEFQYALRILFAGVCGIIIGLERKNRSKEAGIRTHFVVACGAALIMVVSKYAFFDVIGADIYNGAEVRLDPSRVASTIASGIGFLGAGMIFIQKNTIKGLTTAAGIWATSGVGMAIGAGMYILGSLATILILMAQILLHLNFNHHSHFKNKLLIVKDVKIPDFQEYITKEFTTLGITIEDVVIDKNFEEEMSKYILYLKIPVSIYEDTLLSKIPCSASLSNGLDVNYVPKQSDGNE